MDRLEGLDEAMEQEVIKEESSNIVSFEGTKKKRRPFYYWEVNGTEYKLKLTTAMVAKLENKYRTNISNLIMTDKTPPLTVMLTVVQGAMLPWTHGIKIEKVYELYDKWLEETGGGQMTFWSKIVIPTLGVSGFFTAEQTESLMKELEESEDLM